MPAFEEYINAIRVLIAGHCCSEDDLRRAFHVYDQNRNGCIELEEFYRLISIIGRSTTEEKLSNFIERVNPNEDGGLNYEQFKQFARLGHGRDMLVSVSMQT
jgi:Ca2+-binding EF-hand superfamily protein